MDKIEQLYNLYLEKNIISEAITLDQFRASTPEQQKKKTIPLWIRRILYPYRKLDLRSYPH
jgi:hypothetical protein